MSMQKDKKKKLKSLKEADERMKKQKSGEKASRGKKGGKKIAVGIAAGAVVILAAGYGVVGMQFRDRFYPGTVINGIDSGQKTVEEVKAVIRQQSEDYSITIHEMGDQQEVIAGNTIQMKYQDDGSVEKVKEQQNPLLWAFQMFGDQEYTVEAENSYDEASLNAALDGLQALQDQNMTPPQDAKVEDDGTQYVIVPEVTGTTLDKEKTKAAIKAAVDERKTEISLADADCYVKPAVTQEDENLKKEAEQLNRLTSMLVSVNFGTAQEAITRDMLKSWLVKGADGNYTFDETLVKNQVIQWSEVYNTYGRPREFYTSMGYSVQLTGGDYGWRVWQDETTASLMPVLNAGQSQTVDATWLYTGQKHGGNDIDGTYVEISIQDQRMWFYKNGTCLVDTPVVTGNPNEGNGTPAGGVWRLKSKASPFTLTGYNDDGSIDYEEPVTFWMPFNGGVGIHDLTKRTAFGGDIYLWNGSHGCINTPYDAVQTIYNNIEVNTPIVVY
mgnify:FL=1